MTVRTDSTSKRMKRRILNGKGIHRRVRFRFIPNGTPRPSILGLEGRLAALRPEEDVTPWWHNFKTTFCPYRASWDTENAVKVGDKTGYICLFILTGRRAITVDIVNGFSVQAVVGGWLFSTAQGSISPADIATI
jgi:hypothetical protein